MPRPRPDAISRASIVPSIPRDDLPTPPAQQFEDRVGARRVGCWHPGPPAIPRRRSMAATFATTIALIVPVHLRQRQVSAEVNIVEESHPVVRVPSSMQRRRTSSSRGPVALCTEPVRTAWVTSRSRQRRPRHVRQRRSGVHPSRTRSHHGNAKRWHPSPRRLSQMSAPIRPRIPFRERLREDVIRNPCVDQCWQVSVSVRMVAATGTEPSRETRRAAP